LAGNSNVSYFIGIDAEDVLPQRFLTGDRNITNGTAPKNGILELTTNQPAGWTGEMHVMQGNVGLADGSVQMFNSSALRTALEQTGTNNTRLAMP
jgi:hypothetical protein